jgi:large subunit ribosomal protein L5
MSRLKDRYNEEIRPALVKRFGYTSVMQAPKVEKVVLNMGVGEAKQDSKMLDAAAEQLATIAGQKPNVRRARKSIAQFKVREGMPVGLSVTLRGQRAYEFLDRLMSIAVRVSRLPRAQPALLRRPRELHDGRARADHLPEIDYDAIDQVRGLDVTIVTSAQTDREAFALLEALGMPFSREGRPDYAQTQPRLPDMAKTSQRVARRAVPSSRPASTLAAAAAAGPEPCTASSGSAASACASSRTRGSSPG